MERINLSKYGFVRSAEDDFSDDGSRFFCYRVGKVRVSKLVSAGTLYLQGRRDDYSLDYQEYSKLPHYADMDRLNGVFIAGVTDDDLKSFYDACVAYDSEYESALAKVEYPSVEALAEAKRAEIAARKAEWAEVAAMVTADRLLTIGDRYLASLKGYLACVRKAANPETSAEEWARFVRTMPYGRRYLESAADAAKPSYDYRRCLEILKA